MLQPSPLPHRMLHWLFSRPGLIAPQSITVCVWRRCSRVSCDPMMCCRAFTPSLLHIIGIGWLHPISCFSLDCGVLMGFVPHRVPPAHPCLCRPQSFVLRHTGATSTARRLWAAPSALRNAAPWAGASLRSQAPPSSTYQTSVCALSRTCSLLR